MCVLLKWPLFLLNDRSRTGVLAARDGPEGGLSGRSRAPCAPATFAMCLGVTRAIKLGGAPRVALSNDYSHHAWLLRRRQGLLCHSLVVLRRRANFEMAPAHRGRTAPMSRVF